MFISRSRLVGVARFISTSSRLSASHYDVLGITPKATQSDIKAAYYELSKVYHPDKSSDEESAKKFRLITEAYEVLGNVKTKKMYDKGLIFKRDIHGHTAYQPEPEPTDPMLKFYKSRTRRSVMPTMDGKAPIYNFDDWSRNHYGTLFEKKQYEKELMRHRRAKEKDSESASKQETILLTVVCLTALLSILAMNGNTDYDRDRTKSKSDKQDTGTK